MDQAWPLYLACSWYLATASLGATVQYGHVRLGRWRVVHHGLYALTWISVLFAAGTGIVWGATWWWMPLISVPVLLLFPRQRAATHGHRILALAGVISWVLIFTLLEITQQSP